MFYVLLQISHINMPSLSMRSALLCFMGAHAAFDCLFWGNLLDAQQAQA